jgi:hypothetical protein
MTVFHHLKKVLHISSISYMNLRTMYIDNWELKKTRNRLMGYSVKKNEIEKKIFICILYFIMSIFHQGFAIY